MVKAFDMTNNSNKWNKKVNFDCFFLYLNIYYRL